MRHSRRYNPHIFAVNLCSACKPRCSGCRHAFDFARLLTTQIRRRFLYQLGNRRVIYLCFCCVVQPSQKENSWDLFFVRYLSSSAHVNTATRLVNGGICAAQKHCVGGIQVRILYYRSGNVVCVTEQFWSPREIWLFSKLLSHNVQQKDLVSLSVLRYKVVWITKKICTENSKMRSCARD